MKKLIYLLVALAFITSSCKQKARTTEGSGSGIETVFADGQKMQVYYFHATHRCPTCKSIEENVMKVLEDNFRTQLDNGEIKFTILNAEDVSNKALAEKYEAAGAALHLVTLENGTQSDHNLTDFAFSYSRNQPDVFRKGLTDTITSLMHL